MCGTLTPITAEQTVATLAALDDVVTAMENKSLKEDLQFKLTEIQLSLEDEEGKPEPEDQAAWNMATDLLARLDDLS